MVFCSRKTLARLKLNEIAELLIETHVREDHIHLYGFYNIEEKSIFIMLQSVKDVGTKMALSVQDKSVFNKVLGGVKTK